MMKKSSMIITEDDEIPVYCLRGSSKCKACMETIENSSIYSDSPSDDQAAHAQVDMDRQILL